MEKWLIIRVPSAESSDVARYVEALERGTAEEARRCIAGITSARSTEDGGFTYRVETH